MFIRIEMIFFVKSIYAHNHCAAIAAVIKAQFYNLMTERGLSFVYCKFL